MTPQEQSASKAETNEQRPPDNPSAPGQLMHRLLRPVDSLGRGMKSAPASSWALLRDRPLLGIGLAVGSGLGLAAMIGAAEVAVALSAGLLAYQALHAASNSSGSAASHERDDPRGATSHHAPLPR
jgi:hypothetical protein